MKAKKAVKKLAHAETLLAEVVEEFVGGGKTLLSAIDAAKQSVSRARLDVENLRDAEPPAKRISVPVPKKNVRSATARREVKTKRA